jgi:transcriptional regulator with XRE-family HTH domain
MIPSQDSVLRLRVLLAIYHRRQLDVARAAGISSGELAHILAGRRPNTPAERLQRIEDAIVGREEAS